MFRTVSQSALRHTTLLLLSLVGFVNMLVEILPAAVLPQMAGSWRTSQSAAGQLVTCHALLVCVGALVLAPAVRRLPSMPVLATALVAQALGTALVGGAPGLTVALIGRVLSGLAGGVVWTRMATRVIEITPVGRQGRALGIAMLGVPVALGAGAPLAAALTSTFSWRSVFAGLVTLQVLLAAAAWSVRRVGGTSRPAALPSQRGRRTRLPQTALVLLVAVALFAVGHHLAFTYVVALMDSATTGVSVAHGTLVFGLCSIAGALLAQRFADRHAVVLGSSSAGAMVAAVLLLGFARGGWSVIGCLAIWGLAMGGTPTVLQLLAIRRSGPGAEEMAASALVGVLNGGVALGAFAGGLGLDHGGARWGVAAPAAVLLAGGLMAQDISRRLHRRQGGPTDGMVVRTRAAVPQR